VQVLQTNTNSDVLKLLMKILPNSLRGRFRHRVYGLKIIFYLGKGHLAPQNIFTETSKHSTKYNHPLHIKGEPVDIVSTKVSFYGSVTTKR